MILRYLLFSTVFIAQAQHDIQSVESRIQARTQNRHGCLDLRQFALGLTNLVVRRQTFAVEQVDAKLANSEDEFTNCYIRRRLDHEISRLHNPTSEKVKKLFVEFLGLDITESWRWNNYTPKDARERLDKWLKMRGDAVHQVCQSFDPKNAHLIKRDDLDKAVRFFRDLVKVNQSMFT